MQPEFLSGAPGAHLETIVIDESVDGAGVGKRLLVEAEVRIRLFETREDTNGWVMATLRWAPFNDGGGGGGRGGGIKGLIEDAAC